MASGLFFNGSFTRRPRVAARVDDSGLIPFQIGSPRIVAVVGIAEGGVPKQPRLYSNPNEAVRELRKGDLLDAVKFAFDPSTENPGASLVYGVRVNPAAQAVLNLLDGGDVAVIEIDSVNYGKQDNQIKVKVESGTLKGKKVSIGFGTELYVKDNLARDSFQVQYVGAGSAATMTINGTTLTTAVTDGPGGENLSVDLSVYNTVQKLVDFIDAKAAYTATVKTSNPDESVLQGLDFVTAQDIKGAAYTVSANLQAIVDWLNSGQQTLVTATRPAGVGNVPVNVGWSYLAGGSEGSTTNPDWQAAIDALQTKDVAFVVPVSGDASIHAMAELHCSQMSEGGKLPRKAFVGAALGEYTSNLSNYLTRASALNSDRAVLVAQGVKGWDENGNAKTFAPYIAAAQLAGVQSGVPEIGDAITHLSIRATGLEWVPTVAEQEIMIAGGVLPIELVESKGIYRVVRGITTWLKNDGYHRVEISTGIALDEVVRDVLDGLDIFIGQKASPLIAYRVMSRTESLLMGLQQQGIIVGDDRSPAFRNIQVSVAGDVVSVSFECSPVVPINFIAVTVHANTFAGTYKIAVR